MFKLGFIGTGNMGGALLDACAKSVSGTKIAAADADRAKAEAYRLKYGCAVMSPAEIALDAEYIFIGVKPQMARIAGRKRRTP